MTDFNPVSILNIGTDSPTIEHMLDTLETCRRPRITRNDDRKWFDWLLIRRKGIELGFVNKSYFEATPEYGWGRGPSLIFQVYLYTSNFNDNPEILAYPGRLPHDLKFTDSRAQAQKKLSNYSRHESQQTDCWHTENYRLHIRYTPSKTLIESLTLSLPLHPFPEEGRIPCNISCQDWMNLFGANIDSEVINKAVSPLNIRQRMLDSDDEREADFTFESGFEMSFEDNIKSRRTNNQNKQDLVLAAVKFFRARNREARQWTGELPYGLSFSDSPLKALEKIKTPPTIIEESRLTGHFLWHFATHSLHILYSTFDNQLMRITLMTPNYWTTLEK
ncbi:hypothetical protein ABE473_01800 [Stenotrophomonas sp. TWI700]|uniref:hypothetical protein n=1 Tax=Stenotrophomonas sp. TWI700 TaxID=3136792 RepID=UPI00320A6CCB